MPGFGYRYGSGPYGLEIESISLAFTVYQVGVHQVRLIFNKQMQVTPALLATSTYSILPMGGGVGVSVNSVTPENYSAPLIIDLATSEPTGETGYNTYNLSIPPGALYSYDGRALMPPYNSVLFNAVIERPQVVSAIPTGANRLEVEFSEEMEYNDSLRDPASYLLSGGLVAKYVRMVAARKVELYVVPEMATDQMYSVVVIG